MSSSLTWLKNFSWRNQSIDRSIDRMEWNQSINESINRSNGMESINQSINQSFEWNGSNSIDQSINQSINQSNWINQSINQSIVSNSVPSFLSNQLFRISWTCLFYNYPLPFFNRNHWKAVWQKRPKPASELASVTSSRPGRNATTHSARNSTTSSNSSTHGPN